MTIRDDLHHLVDEIAAAAVHELRGDLEREIGL
jgi:hypothetical protein